MKKQRRLWTEEEVKYLKANWGNSPCVAIAEHLQRPRGSLHTKAHFFHLPLLSYNVKSPYFKLGKEEEAELKGKLVTLYITENFTQKEVAEKLGLSLHRTQHLLSKFRIRKTSSQAKQKDSVRKKYSDAAKKRLSNPSNHPRFNDKINSQLCADLYKVGWSKRAIARYMSVDESVIALRLKILGVETRPPLSNYAPNGAELALAKIIQEENLPYKFVGNGEVWIGSHCPDFININGGKKVVELLGRAFHDPNYKYKISDIRLGAIPENIIFHYRLFGYQTLIVWEEELEVESALVQKLRKFEND